MSIFSELYYMYRMCGSQVVWHHQRLWQKHVLTDNKVHIFYINALRSQLGNVWKCLIQLISSWKIQGQIFNLLYLMTKWFNCHEMKKGMYPFNIGLTCSHHFYSRHPGKVITCICLCVHVCLSVCLCIDRKLVCMITHHPFKLGSPNINQRCIRTWFKVPIVLWGNWSWPSR